MTRRIGSFGPSGKALWQAVTREVTPGPYELGLLREACRTLDTIDELQRAIDENGVARSRELVAEARQQRAVYMRLVKMIRVMPGMPVELAEAFQRLLPGA